MFQIFRRYQIIYLVATFFTSYPYSGNSIYPHIDIPPQTGEKKMYHLGFAQYTYTADK